MIVFFISAALLVLLVLVLMLPAVARHQSSVERRDVNVAIARSQLAELTRKHSEGELADTEFELERQRLERDLAGDLTHSDAQLRDGSGRWIVWPVAALVPVLAGVLYLILGTPQAIDPANRQAVAQSAPQTQPTPDMRDVVVRIKERLEQEPEDATGWFMLGRAHMTLGEYPQAVEAIRRAYDLTGENPEVMVRLADAIAMSQEGSMAGEPEPLLVKALALQPDNLQGLWLLGIAQSERTDYSEAIATWQKLLPLVEGDEQSTREVNQLIDGARQSLANATTQTSATPVASDDRPADAATNSLTVEVTLAAGIAEDLDADTLVYVYAKAAQGPPMPLAVARKTLKDLPFKVVLSDRDAMMPTMKLSSFDKVIVGARISLSGNAIAQAGDIFAESGAVPNTQDQPVAIEIGDIVE